MNLKRHFLQKITLSLLFLIPATILEAQFKKELEHQIVISQGVIDELQELAKDVRVNPWFGIDIPIEVALLKVKWSNAKMHVEFFKDTYWNAQSFEGDSRKLAGLKEETLMLYDKILLLTFVPAYVYSWFGNNDYYAYLEKVKRLRDRLQKQDLTPASSLKNLPL